MRRTPERTGPVVSVTRYERPFESVRIAIDLASGSDGLRPDLRVFIKPNLLTWTKSVPFPKWGALTTSRVVEDVVIYLKEHGVNDILIGEGMVLHNIKDREIENHAFETLGYRALERRYGVKCFSIWERPFERVKFGDGIELNYNSDALHSDLLFNIPVLKTHNLTVVSLGMKNLKGLLDISSRKKCHEQDSLSNLHLMIARLPARLPPTFTLLDGIYTLERGPTWEGKARRSNILVASSDLLSADMVGAKILGFDPSEVPSLVHAANAGGRRLDLSDIEIEGEEIESVSSPHEFRFPYNKEGTLPLAFEKMGMQGLSYPKFDLTMCTFCSLISGPIMASIATGWKGKQYGDVEILTGKVMKPSPGKKKTLLLGKCMYEANRDDPNIGQMIAVKGCPPKPKSILRAFREAGIDLNPAIFENLDAYPGFSMKRYENRPEFDESFFSVK
jgi:uncharacterized protein (DUF362 family)